MVKRVRRRAAPSRGAFTLIELLVVVSIVAVLVSILLPSVREMRAQGQRVKCMSNLRAMMQGAYTYFADSQDRFPIISRMENAPGVASSWYYGGKTNSKYWRDSLFYFRADQRPLNPYVLGDEPETGHERGWKPDYDIYRCPADTTSYQRDMAVAAPGNPASIPAYEDVGTSYHFNLIGLFTQEPNPWSDAGDGGVMKEGWDGNLRAIARGGAGGQGQLYARYVFFVEDPGNFSLMRELSTIGNHGKFQRHIAGFLDGHAAPIRIDAEQSAYCGPGYLVRNPAWFWPTVVSGRAVKPVRHYGFGKRCNRGPSWDSYVDDP